MKKNSLQSMKLTDKSFWIVWTIAELLILSSCIYMSVHSKFIGVISVFGASQPLMTVLTLYKKKHRNGALTNLIIICLYSIYSIYISIVGQDANGWGWVLCMIVFPIIQLILLLLFWGIQKLAEITAQNER